MKGKMTFEIDETTMMKLNKRLAKAGMTVDEMIHLIADRGERFFWSRLIGAIAK